MHIKIYQTQQQKKNNTILVLFEAICFILIPIYLKIFYLVSMVKII